MSTASAADGGELASGDLQAIRDLVQRAHNSQGDADVLPALHTEGSVVVNLAGRRVLGASALADAMRAALRSPLRDVRTSVDIVDVRPLSRDTAVVSCLKTVYDERADVTENQQIPAHGALTYVVLKTKSTWRIALAQTTPIAT